MRIPAEVLAKSKLARIVASLVEQSAPTTTISIPCIHLDDVPLSAAERTRLGLSHSVDWRRCEIGRGRYAGGAVVCLCDGCGTGRTNCAGYWPDNGTENSGGEGASTREGIR